MRAFCVLRNASTHATTHIIGMISKENQSMRVKGQTLKRFWKAIFPSRRSKWIIRIPELRRSFRRCLANCRANALVLGLAGVAACAPVSTDSWYDSERNAKGPSFFEKSRKNKKLAPRADKAADGQVTVREGDNYYLIARRNNVSMRALMDANNARAPYRLKPGDRVQLPRPKSYTVQRGDTLYAISRRQGWMWRRWRVLTGCRHPTQFRWGRNYKCPVAKRARGTGPPNVKSRAVDCKGINPASPAGS